MTTTQRALLAAVLVAGALWLAVLLSLVDPDLFYSVDGGMKLLWVREVAQHGFRADVVLAREPWIVELFEAGYAPVQQPFVYWLGDKSYMAFPLAFPAASAVLYAWFGPCGLYVLPAISVVSIWAAFLACGRALGLGFVALASCTCWLVLGSPLTVFGAIFWEHAPAALLTALSVLGVVWVQQRGSASRGGPLFACGALGGLAVWLRPEAALVQACLSLGVVAVCSGDPPRRRFAHAAGVLTAVASFVLANEIVYGHWGGMHLIERATQTAHGDSLAIAVDNGLRMPLHLAHVSPFVLVALAAGAFALRAPPSRWTAAYRLLWPGALLPLVLIPLFTPNAGGRQWGPRYYLAGFPLLVLWSGVAMEMALSTMRRGRILAVLGLGAVLLASVGINVIWGTLHFARFNAQYREPLQAVRALGNEMVVANDGDAPLGLIAVSGSHSFFVVRDERGLLTVARALQEHGYARFTYLARTRGGGPRLLDESAPNSAGFVPDVVVREAGIRVRFQKGARIGEHTVICEAAIDDGRAATKSD